VDELAHPAASQGSAAILAAGLLSTLAGKMPALRVSLERLLFVLIGSSLM